MSPALLNSDKLQYEWDAAGQTNDGVILEMNENTHSLERLARHFEPRHLIAELTSRCNLRCRYCQEASSEWNAIPGRDQDISDSVLENLLDSIETRKFSTVQLSGIGEFTFRKDWVNALVKFYNAGLQVTLISNFAKHFSDEELDALLKLKHLMVSIDTVDAELLRSIRRSVSLGTILSNLIRLRMRAAKTGHSLPYLRLNAVLYRENMLGIEDLAHLAVECRVNEMQYERMMPMSSIKPPHELTDAEPSQARVALQQIAAARELLTRSEITASFHGDLIQTLEIVASRQ